jgi:hypothetical protein
MLSALSDMRWSPRRAQAITPSNTTQYSPPLQWIMLGAAGAAGAVVIVDGAGNTTTFASGDLSPGVQYRMEIAKVLASTTATHIFAWDNPPGF